MGEESINVPSFWKNTRTTSASWFLISGSSPTSNVRDVPMPMTGNNSPEDGIGRRIGAVISPSK
jgi:hypothetical protein